MAIEKKKSSINWPQYDGLLNSIRKIEENYHKEMPSIKEVFTVMECDSNWELKRKRKIDNNGELLPTSMQPAD